MTKWLDQAKLSMSQAAQRIGVSTPTIWRWRHGVRGRRLPTFLVGGRRYVLVDDLDAFIAAGRGPSEHRLPQMDVSDRAYAAAAELERRGV